ncbi:M. jannaschii predicted coding region MJECL43 [Alloactinosynnema sp. L-07]|uniref:AAA family ATPase n=1 Tax=Alloactinosynnema sp. L-07 TaxID=1653480 RepID=UPI00065EF0A7|nr:ATP-binding protein [Alloactinosynnema sp. L-07]CRK56802.1 M. jannaschii predicted coding region MJECL43 [Alloactinosynnema sp. L-07]
MHIREVLIRWYKSFNYDYERKANPRSERKPWQETTDGWLPHVRISLEDDITAVVGANESGKSHLLDAVHIVLTGRNHSQNDFCRYSTLFSVEKDQRLFPEVGAVFALTESDVEALASLKIPLQANGELLMLRPSPGSVEVLDASEVRVVLEDDQIKGLDGLLPHAHLLKTQVDLPDSVSISWLAQTESVLASRKRRCELFQFLAGLNTLELVTTQAAGLFGLLTAARDFETEQQKLGRLLLTKVARIDASAFRDLQKAIADEEEGLVNALVQEMNRSIGRHLNISKWWSQDEDFQLRVSPREHELVFTIRDRTGTDYSFSERSRGLTYFLSYYVQLRSHDRPEGVPEVLLMDEPDAYLSALGQQDLLRVIEDHARPEDTNRTDQVVYVTHSPFLINRNAGHRVRVVDKGTRQEGTRQVKDATQNHYEPLRTSLGAFIAETAFIGGDNLFIEGISDQVLIAGMNARLRRKGTAPSECLDLNQVTLVPGGSNVPYMLYLARGRSQYKPACAVLLDSDKAGRTAQAQIKKGGTRGKPTVTDELVVMLGDWAVTAGAVAVDGVTIEEPEDLVPTNLAGVAARRYAMHFLGYSEKETAKLQDAHISAAINVDNTSMWDAIASAFKAAFDTEIGKAGFAKELLAYAKEHQDDEIQPDGVEVLERNFASLIKKLAETLELARTKENDSRRDQRVQRIIDEFADDHPNGTLRDRASTMLKRIDAAADDTEDGDMIRAGTSRIRRDFKLDTDPLDKVPEYDKFLDRLNSLPLYVRLRDQGAITQAEVELGREEDTATGPEATKPM